MTDLFLPSNLVPSRMSWSIDDFTMADESAVTGATQTSELYGTRRWRCRLDFDVLSSRDGTLHAYDGFIAAMRGKANRVWVPDAARRQRGSFSAPELLANPTFADGTSGWAATAGRAVLSVANRVLRMTAARSFDGSIVPQASASGESAAVQYAAYVARQLTLRGRGDMGTAGPYMTSGGVEAFSYGAPGLRSAALVVPSTAVDMVLVAGNASSGYEAGDFVEVPYTSLARCGLVDGGGNFLLRSDDAATTWAPTGVTISANAHTSPDGTATADAMIEDSSTGFHYIQQTYTRAAAVEDWCAYFDAGRTSGTRNITCDLSDLTGTASCTFDLGTGAVGTVSTGGGVTNGRAFAVDLGNGYWRCYVVARLQSTTSVRVQLLMHNGSGNSYAGNGTSRIALWRMGANRTGAPSRPTQTTSAVSGPASQSGAAIHLKALPPGAAGVALPGDVVEVGGERKRVVAPLNIDSAGRGYLQFEPPMRVAAADNAPVIFGDPLCRMRLAGNNLGTEYAPGVFGQGSIELVEA